MDPNFTFNVWREAIRIGNTELADHARLNLMTWLDLGGAEPRWTRAQRIAFYLVSP